MTAQWSATTRYIPEMNAYEYTLLQGNTPLTYHDVFEGWSTSAEFRNFYINILTQVSFAACFWETPAVTRTTTHRPYRFVLVDSPTLARVRPDVSTFAQHFRVETVACFDNLSRSSRLIAPVPSGNLNFAHLLAFLRAAERKQAHDLFISIGNEMKAALDDRPLWLSTSGLGVYWTHVRLDRRPKYYTYDAYKKWPIVDDVVNRDECPVDTVMSSVPISR